LKTSFFGTVIILFIDPLAAGGTFDLSIAAITMLVTHVLEFAAIFMLAAFRGASEMANPEAEATSFQGSTSHGFSLMSLEGPVMA
jgi:hypothetical protein